MAWLNRTLGSEVIRRLRHNPVVALLGARQTGKTTLAHQIALDQKRLVHWLDLEKPEDARLLEQAEAALLPLRGLVIIDEVQRAPGLFSLLRVLADRSRSPARFLLLGSSSPALLAGSSESLAGRISYVELPGLSISEVSADRWKRLWLRGGFPRSFLATSAAISRRWRREFIRTFLSRDLPDLGIRIAATTMERFWAMLAHVHGQVLNWSELGRSIGANDHTVRRYVDVLAQTFMVRTLQPWHANISKRQVKAPKVYFRDPGLLHSLLDIDTERDLLSHPRVGASFEGFVIEQLLTHLQAESDEAFFWRTHDGSELDLLIVRGGKRRGFEVKLGGGAAVTPSMRHAMSDLELDSLDVIHAGVRTWSISDRIRAVALERMIVDVNPL